MQPLKDETPDLGHSYRLNTLEGRENRMQVGPVRVGEAIGVRGNPPRDRRTETRVI